MRPDKAKVVDEIWDDARINSLLEKAPMGNENGDFSVMLNAYRSMRAEDFQRFIIAFKARGGDLDARDTQGRTLFELIASHDKAQPFREALQS